MYYPGWLAAYLIASLLSGVLGVPYPIALLLIALTWLARDRLDLRFLMRRFASSSALQDAQREAALNPRNAEAHFQAGRLLVDRGRHAEAMPHLRAALERMDGSAEAHALLGTALLAAEGPATARPHLERAIAMNPRFRQGEAHLRLAEALEREGKPEQAFDVLIGFFGEHTTSVEALYRMGITLRAAGREDEAHSALAAAKEAYAGNPRFRRRRDRAWAMRARRAGGEKLVADPLILGVIVGGGLLLWAWRAWR